MGYGPIFLSYNTFLNPSPALQQDKDVQYTFISILLSTKATIS
jgi:hypothetical protein